MPSVVRGRYDGRRRGKDMVLVMPASVWGGRAYGLDRNLGDDFRIEPAGATKGQEVTLTLATGTYLRLVRDRDRRRAHRRRRR